MLVSGLTSVSLVARDEVHGGWDIAPARGCCAPRVTHCLLNERMNEESISPSVRQSPLAVLGPGHSADSQALRGAGPRPGRGREGLSRRSRREGLGGLQRGAHGSLPPHTPRPPEPVGRAGPAAPEATSTAAPAPRGGRTRMSLCLCLLVPRRSRPGGGSGRHRVPVPVPIPVPVRSPPCSPSSKSFSSPRSRFFCSRRILLISWSMRAAAFSSSVRHHGQQRQVSERAMAGVSAGTRPHGPGPRGRAPRPAGPGEGSWQWPVGGGAPLETPDVPALGTGRPERRGLSARHRRVGAGGGAREGVEAQGSPPISRPACPALPNWLRVGAPGEGGLPAREGPDRSLPPAAPAGSSFLILEEAWTPSSLASDAASRLAPGPPLLPLLRAN